MPKRITLLDYHLRNLSLKHVAKAWSMLYRGYTLADYEYYSQQFPYWIGFVVMDFKHILKPKPSLRLYKKDYHCPSICDNLGNYCINFEYYEKI